MCSSTLLTLDARDSKRLYVLIDLQQTSKKKAGTSSGPDALFTPFLCIQIESIIEWLLVPFIGMLDLSSL